MDKTRERARRLIEKGTDENRENTLQLLDNCLICGDARAMLDLAKCCALGHGMKQNGELAKLLLSESAKKGNKEAKYLMTVVNQHQKTGKSISLNRLHIILSQRLRKF